MCVKKERNKTLLPQLAYGEGTMNLNENGMIVYKKYIHLKDGNSVRKTVNAKTVTECFKKMSKLEKKLHKGKREGQQKDKSLREEMTFWLNEVKKNRLKRQSFQRLESTIRIHILPSELGYMEVSMITSKDLQRFINSYNDGRYSYSSIKKIYDCLNEYFRYISLRDGFENPMLSVYSISKHNVMKREKKAQYLNKEDIDRFKSEAARTWKSSGKLRYKYGYVLIANLYLGLRIGELLALTWNDIHFDDNYIDVNKTLVQEKNTGIKPRDGNDDQKRTVFVIQDSTKTNKNRKVPMNRTAKNYLEKHLEITDHKGPEDYVIATKTGNNSNTKNIQSSIALIIKNAHIKVEATNTHIMRHTCASLLYNNGVDLHSIAMILGNSEEVLKKTYVHFEEDTLMSIMEMIDFID